jgi:hypothetical protein
MLDGIRVARRLSTVLLAVMLTQAITGLAFRAAYRDVEWIRATWFGNDWVTLIVAAPLLSIGLARTAVGSVRGLLLWLGLIGYALYNYAFYLFGAALNAFFPIYVVALVLAVTVLVLALSHIDTARLSNSVGRTAPMRLVGGSLVFIAIGLASAWLAMWAAYVFAGRPTPVEPEAFKLVAALDLSLMVPVLGVGGVLIWRRMPWGLVISAIASIQGALYLLVLSVNSVVAIHRGLTTAPGELPIWGTLTIFTGGGWHSFCSQVFDLNASRRVGPARHLAACGDAAGFGSAPASSRMTSPPIAVAGCIHDT